MEEEKKEFASTIRHDKDLATGFRGVALKPTRQKHSGRNRNDVVGCCSK